MAYLDTLQASLGRAHARVLAGAEQLETEAREILDSEPAAEERREFRRSAAAGTRAFAEEMQTGIARGDNGDDLLRRAEMVERAAFAAGWLTASGIGGLDEYSRAAAELVDAGFFGFYPAVPGQWVACYRIVEPA